MSKSRLAFSLLTAPLWIGLVLVGVSALSFFEGRALPYVLCGAIIKLGLWCSGFYEWNRADLFTRRIRFTKSTENIWNIQ